MSPWVSAVSDERIDPGDQSALGRARAADLLGVDVGASVADIQRAFRSAVKEAHPDGGGTDGEAFGDLHTAREILLGRGSARSASPARGRDGEGSGADGGDGESMPDEDSAPKPQSTRAGDRSARVGGEPPRRSASPSTAGHAPADGDRSALFGRGVLLMAAGLGLLIGLLVAAMVVSGNESQSVRIAPTAEAPDECIVVSAGTIEGASCDAPGALSIVSQSASSAACATGTTRLEIPNGDTFCLRPEAQD